MSEYIFPDVPVAFASGDKIIFNYCDKVQAFQFTYGIKTIKIECFGAQGGGGNNDFGGLGGYAYGELDYSALRKDLFIVTGERPPSPNTRSFNGGGCGSGGFGGGGATDVRTSFDDDLFKQESLVTRFIVAGGGGGQDFSGRRRGPGSPAGGWSGGDGGRCGGGGQTGGGGCWDGCGANGSFGRGGDGWGANGGGGSGWYGGGAGDGAAGGSSYVAGNPNCPTPNPEGIVLANSNSIAAYNQGPGKVVFTVIEPGDTLYNKCLKVVKENNLVKIPLFETNKYLPAPLLHLRDSGKHLYAVLCDVKYKLASPLRIRVNNAVYAALRTRDPINPIQRPDTPPPPPSYSVDEYDIEVYPKPEINSILIVVKWATKTPKIHAVLPDNNSLPVNIDLVDSDNQKWIKNTDGDYCWTYPNFPNKNYEKWSEHVSFTGFEKYSVVGDVIIKPLEIDNYSIECEAACSKTPESPWVEETIVFHNVKRLPVKIYINDVVKTFDSSGLEKLDSLSYRYRLKNNLPTQEQADQARDDLAKSHSTIKGVPGYSNVVSLKIGGQSA